MDGKRTSRGPLKPRDYLALGQQPKSPSDDGPRLNCGCRVTTGGPRQLKQAGLVILGSSCIFVVDEGNGNFAKVVGAPPFASHWANFGFLYSLTLEFSGAHSPE
jgi:hypothetical protein